MLTATALWCAIAIRVLYSGPMLLQEAERRAAAEAERASAAVCDRLGMPDGTEGRTACLREMRELREQRLAGQSTSLL